MKDLEIIKKAVEEHFNLEMTFDTRAPDQVKARAICYDLCRKFTKKAYRVIGEYFGGKNHATVMYGIKTSAQFFNSEKNYRISKMRIILKIAPHFPDYVDAEVQESFKFSDLENEVQLYKNLYEEVKQEKDALIETLDSSTLKNISSLVSKLNEKQLIELENFRIKPFVRMCQNQA